MLRPVLVVLCVVARVSWATDEFPAVIQAKYSLSAPPAELCGLCHVGSPGPGTVNTPLGVSLRQRGLVRYDNASLMRALDRLVAEGIDSDRDGRTDVDELIAGTNSNVAEVTSGGGGELVLPPPIGYGCGAFAVDGAPLVLLLLLLGRPSPRPSPPRGEGGTRA